MNTEQNPAKKKGCFFYGCISAIVLSLICLLAALILYRSLLSSTARWIQEFTDTAPVTIESVELPAPQFEALQKRVAAFKAALDVAKASQELVLTAEEINALIATDPGLKDLKNKLFVILEGDRVQGKVSIPLHDLGPLKLNGRYLNGLAGFQASLQNGLLRVTLDSVEVKGKPLPAPVMAQLKAQNLAQDAQKNPQTAQAIQRFESIQVTDGKLILRNKVK